jgi:hypothetical protein
MAWQRQAQVRPAQEGMEAHPQPSAGGVRGTQMQARHVSDAEVIRAETAPSGVEGGVPWLNEPWFFVSSRFVKNPRRLQGSIAGHDVGVAGVIVDATPLASVMSRSP